MSEEKFSEADIDKGLQESRLESERQAAFKPGDTVVWRTEANKAQFTRPAYGFSAGPFEIISVQTNAMGRGAVGQEKKLILKDVNTGKTTTSEISAYYFLIQT